MRFTALPLFLLALTLGLPSAQATQGTQATQQIQAAQETVVVTTSGPTFPWGLLGILGLMGLARRHPPRRVPAPQEMAAHSAETGADERPASDLDDWATEDPFAEDHTNGDSFGGRRDTPLHPPEQPHRAAASDHMADQSDPAPWPTAEAESQLLSGDPVLSAQSQARPRLSERLSRRQPGAPDLSKPPGRR